MVEPDEELVERTRRGEREAFSRLVQRYQRPAIAVAKSILHCSHDAADAAQDAFVSAYEQLNRLWSAKKFGAWLLKIVRRQSLLALRRQKTRDQRTVAADMESQSDPRNIEPASVDVISLMARLPEQECVVVSLRHLEDLSINQIAQITGRPVGTVTKQLSRAHARLRSWLDEQK